MAQIDASIYAPSAEELDEYDRRLKEATELEESVPVLFVENQPVEWFPQAGSQVSFMECKVMEAMLHGPRGTGKTDVLVMDFVCDCEQGLGADWRGILFRETYPQLADVVAKTKKWFPRMFGSRVKFNSSSMQWEWNTGEILFLRHMRVEDDYLKYHGHAYPWQGWEELTNWSNDSCYKRMFSCCRSDNPLVPRRIRSTANPYGPGHAWVKLRFRLPGSSGKIILDAKTLEGRKEFPRVAIQAFWGENKILMRATPDYEEVIASSARTKSERLAWLNGRWDIVSGGILDEAWLRARDYALVEEFLIPKSWRIYRAFDWGESAPFSVGWYALSNGEGSNGFIPGDIIRIHEWYGWNSQPNVGCGLTVQEISQGIIEREMEWGIHRRVSPGPADNQIWTRVNQQSLADDMEKPVKVDGQWWKGAEWEACDKSPGSRVAGADRMRQMLLNTIPNGNSPREKAGFFLVRGRNEHWERTVPVLARDSKKPDDADTTAEDHVYDECRYMLQWEPYVFVVRRQ